jgi:hypothetical protein
LERTKNIEEKGIKQSTNRANDKVKRWCQSRRGKAERSQAYFVFGFLCCVVFCGHFLTSEKEEKEKGEEIEENKERINSERRSMQLDKENSERERGSEGSNQRK